MGAILKPKMRTRLPTEATRKNARYMQHHWHLVDELIGLPVSGGRHLRQEDQLVNGNLVAVELVIQRGMFDMSTRLTLLLFKNASRSMCDISQKMHGFARAPHGHSIQE